MSPICGLWIDDQPETFLVLKHLPELNAIKWYHAASSVEAQKMVEEILPHFVVLDLHLGPDDKGLDWLLQLRKGRYRRVPVICMTSSAEVASVKSALSMGAEDYILKPAHPKTLAKKILQLKTRIESKPTYAFQPETAHHEFAVSLEVDAEMLGLSETGVMISCALSGDRAFDISEPESKIFSAAGIQSPPRLSILKSIHDPRYPDGSVRKHVCMWKGFRKEDMTVLRKWIRDNKLSRGG